MAPTCTLGMVLAELGAAGSLIAKSEAWLNHPVSHTMIWLLTSTPPSSGDVVIVCPDPATDAAMLAPLLESKTPRMLVVAAPRDAATAEHLARHGRQHAIVVLEPGTEASEVVTAVARATQTTEVSVSRRLASLQRTLSRALSDAAPVESVLNRLKRICNATIVLLDRHGESLHATGPVPLSLLFSEIAKTAADSQIIDIEGWHGVATRLVDPDDPGEHLGWLVAAARRTPFPDPYTMSAVHIAATLIEVNRRMTVVARIQERAVRATVLEQALAVRPHRHDPEIAGRMAGLGVSFDEEMRAVALRPLRSARKALAAEVLETLAAAANSALNAAALANLFTLREQAVVLVIQGDAAQINSALAGLGNIHIGIGRPVVVVADVADSYHDAQLAVRTLRRTASGAATMTYEDFDFATALFSDVGLDKMAERAQQYLVAVTERESLVEGLQAYFDHGQNIIAAADELNIHHNSLRYRLSKIEGLLNIKLKDAADIASVFLALTALDLSGKLHLRGTRLPARAAASSTRAADVATSGAATDYLAEQTGLGVVLGGDD
jgi:DNA-binding PucR family transcriptional regulator